MSIPDATPAWRYCNLRRRAGATATDADVLTTPSIPQSGDRFCQDTRPVDNARTANAADLREDAGRNVTPIFITTDPERDTSAVRAASTGCTRAWMIGLTGRDAQTAAASVACRACDNRQPGLGFIDFVPRGEPAQGVADRNTGFVNAAAN